MAERLNSVDGVRRGTGFKVLPGLIALALCLAACGTSTPDDDVTLPSSTEESGNAEEPATSSSVETTDDDSPDEQTDDTTDESPTTTESSGQPRSEMDEEVLREELFNRVKEARDAFLDCVDVPEECDFENDFVPFASGPYKTESEEAYRSMLEGGLQSQVAETDGTFYVGFLAQDVTPFQAIVRACVLDTGVIFKPGENGSADEIVNDDAFAKTIDYLVLEDAEGNLRVDDRDQLEKTEDLTLCDEYM